MTQSKTIREWFEQCDEPWAKEALENSMDASVFGCHDVNEESLSSAIHGGFLWCLTPQGHTYWFDIVYDLQSKNQ